MFHNKNIQAQNSYGNESDKETFAKKTDIKNSDNNDLVAKAKALKSFEKSIVSV